MWFKQKIKLQIMQCIKYLIQKAATTIIDPEISAKKKEYRIFHD